MIENININEFINEINSLDKNNIEFKNKENYCKSLISKNKKNKQQYLEILKEKYKKCPHPTIMIIYQGYLYAEKYENKKRKIRKRKGLINKQKINLLNLFL